MNLTHDRLLADLEARLHTTAMSLDELDGRVAAALGVGVDEYRDYLRVRGALEARRQVLLATTPAEAVMPGAVEPCATDAVLARVRQQADVIAGLAAACYQAASAARDREAVSAAARLLGSLLALRHNLSELEASRRSRLRRGRSRRSRRG